ncbi:sulfatase [Blastopirellula marina]|uniref:Sulfatase n=1 Tax=Blastopirellula marina TaxID=124 RepID=A0A2S8G3R3_9BACT|nr:MULTISPECIES: sulfatase-like hydrolase/transferase [Pirellulaceae]PQO38930.1 sulfatase [Blastopirellula marina]RCS55238.1 sulfatase [Bremerella cremea]
MLRGLLSVFLLLLSCGSLLAAEKPNFVWIMSEDNSSHFLSLFDSTGAQTPNIEALAQQGLIYEHAFSNAPVCSVARTTLITSCYAPRIGTFHHRRSFMVPMPEGVKMFPAYLRETGYYTTNNSKEDYNAKKSDDVWDDSSRKASWKNRAQGQPFFHVQTFTTTHESSLHFPVQDVQNKPTKTDPETVFVPPHHPKTETFKYTYARYHDRIQDVDQQIGELVDQLKQDGLLESTFIFYFGDHGGVLPRGKGYAYETGLHVPLVIRVPEKFRDQMPEKIGSRIQSFVSFVDFGPTVLNLAGAKIPDGIDGHAFLALGNAQLMEVDESFGYADRFDEKYDVVRTLRKGKYRYVRNFQPFNFDGLMNNYRYKMAAYQEWRELYDAGKLNEVQAQFFKTRPAEMLFDVEADPYETKNLADDPAHAKTLSVMRGALSIMLKGMPDLGFYPENYLAAHAADNPVAFGQQHKDEIAKLIETANLEVLSFDEARPRLEEALASSDPWQRYWGVIACTSHGKTASPLVKQLEAIATSDPENLVRVRAAEYLALHANVNPVAVLKKAIADAETATEANLILNTVVLLQDGQPGYEFNFQKSDFKHLKGDRGELNRRLEYLTEK